MVPRIFYSRQAGYPGTANAHAAGQFGRNRADCLQKKKAGELQSIESVDSGFDA